MMIQEDGTWVDWVDVDPDRIRRLKAAAVNQLEVYAGICPKFGTDSEDGESMRSYRQAATRKKTLAGLSGWLCDADYFQDSHSDSSSQAENLPSCVGPGALPSGSPHGEDGNEMTDPAFNMLVGVVWAPSCAFTQDFAFFYRVVPVPRHLSSLREASELAPEVVLVPPPPAFQHHLPQNVAPTQ